ncbi:MAG: sulfotransferase family protein [Planctomycetota bacterium]
MMEYQASPIILLGTHRSGTTWMGSILSNLPGVAYWIEPRHVWTRGNAYTPDDSLAAKHATERVRRRIRSIFSRYLKAQGAERLLEKTPSNCLRVPFIHAVYPNARFLLIVRDGRSVISSTEQMQERVVPGARIWQRMRETPVWEWPAASTQLKEAARTRITGQPQRYWGPRPPGWREWMRSDPPHVIRAKQWAATILNAWRACHQLPTESWSVLRYEELVRQPAEELTRVLGELGIHDVGNTIELARQSSLTSRVDAWRERVDSSTLAEVYPSMRDAMETLGYKWDTP